MTCCTSDGITPLAELPIAAPQAAAVENSRTHKTPCNRFIRKLPLDILLGCRTNRIRKLASCAYCMPIRQIRYGTKVRSVLGRAATHPSPRRTGPDFDFSTVFLQHVSLFAVVFRFDQ